MAGKYIDNGTDLPAAKNRLERADDHIVMHLNGGAGGSIKLDEGSLSKVIESSWSVASGKGNNYVSATIDGNRVAMHRHLLDVVDTEMKLEFVNENKFDLRLKNIRSKSMGHLKRSQEREQAEISHKIQKSVAILQDTEVRSEIKQMAMSMCADALSVLASIYMNPEQRGSDRIAAAKEILTRGIGPAGDEPITGASLPRIEISFAAPRIEKEVLDEGAETASLNIHQVLVPSFG